MSAKQDIERMMRKLLKMGENTQKEIKEVGDLAVELIKKRTRLGFGVKSHGATKKKLKKLDPKYKKARKKNKPTGPTTPARSNLTHSGDMLDDLHAKQKFTGKITIGFKTDDSADKAGWVSDDRPFNNLSKAEIKQLKQRLDKKAKKEADKV